MKGTLGFISITAGVITIFGLGVALLVYSTFTSSKKTDEPQAMHGDASRSMVRDAVKSNDQQKVEEGQVVVTNKDQSLNNEGEGDIAISVSDDNNKIDGANIVETGDVSKSDSEKQEKNIELAQISFKGKVIAGKTSPLLDFNQEDYDRAIASDKLVVLYFYANWCPICRDEVKNGLYPAFNALQHDDIVGFQLHYRDKEETSDEVNIARQFGVSSQHTKIFIKNGERILKSPVSWSDTQYEQEFKSAL